MACTWTNADIVRIDEHFPGVGPVMEGLVGNLRQTEAARVAAVDQRDRALRLAEALIDYCVSDHDVDTTGRRYIKTLTALRAECGGAGKGVQR